MIIDFHTHTFPAKISARVLKQLSECSGTKYYTAGSAEALQSSMQASGVDWSVNLPVMTDSAQVEKVNGSLIAAAAALRSQGIVTFGGMHPDYADYKAELRRLKENGIAGIKLHPAYQRTVLDDIRMLRVIGYASELGLIVITHAGLDIGIFDRNYASVEMILRVIAQVQPQKLVLAHMGGWAGWEAVERELAGAPVWFDTAFTIGRIETNGIVTGNPDQERYLSDADFLRLVRKHGADKILFATDSPWKAQNDYVARFQALPLSDAERENILYRNAATLLHDIEL